MNDALIPVFSILGGLALLIAGGELLVRGASALAAAARISPLVIGLTVVAFGTSFPELAVCLQSAWTGNVELVVGNVVGSNIANVLLILGLSAVIAPLVVASQLIRLDVPLMIAACVAMLLLALDGTVGRLDGCLLFGGLLVYTGWLIRQSRKEPRAIQDEFAENISPAPSTSTGRIVLQLGLIIAGLVLLGLGSRWLVDGAVAIARLLGVQELIIGLTVVAVGTSLPEIVTSITAALRGQRDIAVGNIVGSNLFNVLCVLGLTAIAAPAGVDVGQTALRVDIPIMIAVAVACLPVFFTGYRIARWEGALFLAYYVAYTAYLILAATQPEISRGLVTAMLGFAVPLTVVTLLVGVFRAWREKRASGTVGR